MDLMKNCGTAVCMSRGKLCVDFRCTLSHAVLSIIIEALLAYHIMSPCVVDYVFINLPKCYNFLKKLSNFFIYMTAQNSSEKDVWIHYK